MFRLLVRLLVFRSVLMMEDGMNYHESILQNVTLYRTDSSASEIPLLMLKTNSSTFEAICFRKSSVQQLTSLSLAICRTLGYVALQRAYSVDARLLDGMNHSRGLLLDVNCITPELELQHCKWRYAKRVSCFLYLGVNCAECNHTVEITEGSEQEIVFPVHMPCSPHAYCDWNIHNNQIMKKTVLEFNKQNADPTVPVASVSSNAAQMLEVHWFDIGNGTWTKIRGTFTRIANMGPIKIQSDRIMVRYFFVDCNFRDPTRIMEGNIAYLKYYNEEYTAHEAEAASYFMPLALCTFVATLMMLITCAWCYVRKRKQKMYSKHAFTMTYIPGLNITYEEDETKPADTWPAVYHQLSVEDENAYLSSLISYNSHKPRTSEKQLLMDTMFHHVEPLRTAVEQLATQHRKPSVGAQRLGSEEEIFSCSSHESLHSFHSVYPVTCNSVSSSDSFTSINPELQNPHPMDI
ncbi:hypothetical protein B7P43_G15925 [Cryptotermes secundus]|nr:uncharacterized protein LOC111875330 isoform X2 [Cryptotermes secundus]PNF40873.1 hypothetical protein B7P43_G15925 [Cryptotermes secundus]